jgi:hypothetical protein
LTFPLPLPLLCLLPLPLPLLAVAVAVAFAIAVAFACFFVCHPVRDLLLFLALLFQLSNPERSTVAFLSFAFLVVIPEGDLLLRSRLRIPQETNSPTTPSTYTQFIQKPQRFSPWSSLGIIAVYRSSP